MSQFKAGDRVRTTNTDDHYNGEEGIVVGAEGTYYDGIGRLVTVKLDRGGQERVFAPYELKLTEPEFVHTVDRSARDIWVTLPGDNAGHRLTEQQAYALFRQLEEIL